MNTRILLILILSLAAQNTFAIKLNEQIKQNVENATKSYKELVNQEPLKLWIHVRNEQQKQLVQQIADWFNPLGLIKVEPVQIVKEGPKKTKLRFFSKQDKDEADDLLKKLQKFFPQLELQDFSTEYGDMPWLQSGYYELWLAPDVTKIVLPDPPVPAEK